MKRGGETFAFAAVEMFFGYTSRKHYFCYFTTHGKNNFLGITTGFLSSCFEPKALHSLRIVTNQKEEIYTRSAH